MGEYTLLNTTRSMAGIKTINKQSVAGIALNVLKYLYNYAPFQNGKKTATENIL